MENRVLNEIRIFAKKYGYQNVLDMIDSIDLKGENLSVREGIIDVIRAVFYSVKDDVITDSVEAEIQLKKSYRNCTIAQSKVLQNVSYEDDVKNFINFEEVIVNGYTNRKRNDELAVVPSRNITTLEGKLDKPIKKNNKGWVIPLVGFVALGSILLAGLYLNKDKKDNADKNLPNEENPIENPVEISDKEELTEIKDEITDEMIEEAASEVYENWSLITDEYTIDDIKEIVKAINGLDSTISIDTADEIITSMIGKATIPKVNNILMGRKFEKKSIKVTPLVLNNKYGFDYIKRMENYLNSAIDGEDLKDLAVKSFKDEILVINGALDDASGAVKLVESRLIIWMNAINGTQNSNLCIDVNNELYTQKDLNNSDLFDGLAKLAKMQISGKLIN